MGNNILCHFLFLNYKFYLDCHLYTLHSIHNIREWCHIYKYKRNIARSRPSLLFHDYRQRLEFHKDLGSYLNRNKKCWYFLSKLKVHKYHIHWQGYFLRHIGLNQSIYIPGHHNCFLFLISSFPELYSF